MRADTLPDRDTPESNMLGSRGPVESSVNLCDDGVRARYHHLISDWHPRQSMDTAGELIKTICVGANADKAHAIVKLDREVRSRLRAQ